MNAGHRESDMTFVSLLLQSLKAAGIAAAVGLALLTLLSVVSYKMDDPDRLSRVFAYAALYISSLVCGILGVRFSKAGLLSGLCAGAVFLLLIMIASVALPKQRDGTTTVLVSIALHAAVIAVALLGSLIGKKRTNSKPKRRLGKAPRKR